MNKAEALADIGEVESKAEGAAGKVEGSFGGMGGMFAKLAGPAAIGAVAVALVAAGKAGFDAYAEIDGAAKDFQVQTGASVQESERFAESMKELRRVNTDSFADIGDNLTTVRQRFGDLGDEMVPVTQNFMDYAKVTGQQTAPAIEQMHSILKAFNLDVTDSGPLMDKLKVAQEQTGISATTLQGALEGSSVQLQTLGISLDEGIAMMAAFETQGVDATAMQTALRNVINNTVEPTEKQATALQTLGINVEGVTDPTERARIAFEGITERMSEGTLSAEEFAAAGDILGNRVAADMVRGLGGGKDAIDELTSALENSEGAVTSASATYDMELGERWTLIQRNYLEPFLITIGEGLVGALEMGLDFIETWGPTIEGYFEGVKEVGTELFTGLKNAWENVLLPSWKAIEPFMSGLFSALGSTLRAFGLLLEGDFVGAAQAAWDGFKAAFEGLQTTVVNIITGLWGLISQPLINLRDNAVGKAEELRDDFVEWIRQLGTGTVGIFTGLWALVASSLITFKDNAVGKAEELKDGFQGWLEQLRDKVSDLLGGFWELVSGSLITFRDNAVSTAEELRDGFVEWLTSLRTGVTDTLGGLWESVSGALTTFKDNVVAKAQELKDGFVLQLEAVPTAVTTALSGLWDAVSATLTTFVSNTVAKATEVKDGFGTAFTSLRDDLVTQVSGLWEGIRTYIETLVTNIVTEILSIPTKLANVGSDIVSGITGGITDNLSRATDAAGNLASSVSDKVTGFFGIKSPSTLFAGFGLNLVEGLAAGLQDEGANANLTTSAEYMAGNAMNAVMRVIGLSDVYGAASGTGGSIVQGLMDGFMQRFDTFAAVVRQISDEYRWAMYLNTQAEAEALQNREIARTIAADTEAATRLWAVNEANRLMFENVANDAEARRIMQDTARAQAEYESGLRVWGVEQANLQMQQNAINDGEARRIMLDTEAAQRQWAVDEANRQMLQNVANDAEARRIALDTENAQRMWAAEQAGLTQMAAADNFYNTSDWVGQTWTNLTTWVGGVWENMTSWIEQASGYIGDKLIGLARDNIPFLGSAMDAMAYGPIAVLAAMFIELFQKTDQFGWIVDAVNKLFTPLIETAGKLLDALWPLIQISLNLMSIGLQPLVWLMSNVVNPVLSFVARTVASVWNAIARGLNAALGWLGVNIGYINVSSGVPSSGGGPSAGPKPAPGAPNNPGRPPPSRSPSAPSSKPPKSPGASPPKAPGGSAPTRPGSGGAPGKGGSAPGAGKGGGSKSPGGGKSPVAGKPKSPGGSAKPKTPKQTQPKKPGTPRSPTPPKGRQPRSPTSPGSPKTPGGESGRGGSGGTKVSEITGPTRDMFVDLLSPLANLDTLTGIANRIYDVLDQRLGGAPITLNPGSPAISGGFNLTVNMPKATGRLEYDARELARAVTPHLARAMRAHVRGTGS